MLEALVLFYFVVMRGQEYEYEVKGPFSTWEECQAHWERTYVGSECYAKPKEGAK